MRIRHAIGIGVLTIIGAAWWVAIQPPQLMPQQEWLYGNSRNLPPSVMIVFEMDQVGGITGIGSSFLVDAKEGLFLTANHVIDYGPVVGAVRLPNGTLDRVVALWRNGPADQMVFRIAHPDLVRDIPVLPISQILPVAGQELTVNAWVPIPIGNESIDIRGFKRKLRVDKAATDNCEAADGSDRCEFIRLKMMLRLPITLAEAMTIYPYSIAFVHDDPYHLYGLQRGMSGGPALDANGVVVGIVSSIGDRFGRQGMLSPAYRTLPILQDARAAIAAGLVK